jgi:hypothetical protein
VPDFVERALKAKFKDLGDNQTVVPTSSLKD